MKAKAVLLGAIVAIGIAGAAQARWKPEYAAVSPEVRAWYEKRMTTPEWRLRTGHGWYRYCCDEADAHNVEARRTDDGHWQYRLSDTEDWHTLPDDVVQEDVQTPYGKPVVFIDTTFLHAGAVCFFPGGAGS